MHRIMRADLRIDTAPAEAREILADRGAFTGRQHILGRGLAIVKSYIKENDFDAALAEASQLEAALPDHPQGPLAHFRVKNARGDEDIHAGYDRALALIGEDTDFSTRFLVAEVLGSVEQFDEVVDILYKKTSHRFDSPALRAHRRGSGECGCEATLRKIFKDLPPEVANQPFYAKAKIALAISSGDIPARKTDISAFLQNDPSKSRTSYSASSRAVSPEQDGGAEKSHGPARGPIQGTAHRLYQARSLQGWVRQLGRRHAALPMRRCWQIPTANPSAWATSAYFCGPDIPVS